MNPTQLELTSEELEAYNNAGNNLTEQFGRAVDKDHSSQRRTGGNKMSEEINEESKNVIETKQESKQESNWLEEEAKEVATQGDFGEKLPSPKFEDGVITIMNIDATKPFQKWTDPETKKVKAIVPCTSDVNGKAQKCNWWCNLKNPIYKDVIDKCKDAADKSNVLVKILQSGTQDKTRYTLIKEGVKTTTEEVVLTK